MQAIAETIPQTAEVAVSDEYGRIAQFRELLAQTVEARVINTSLAMGAEAPIEDAVRSFTSMERQGATALHLAPGMQELAQAGQPTFLPRRSRSGKRSAHGVFFGDLFFNDGSSVPVAVKPHADDSIRSCATDYFTNEGALELGMESLESVGMLIGSDGQAFSMTRLENIRTFDDIDWRGMANTSSESFLNAWSQVARGTSMLHAAGRASHRDLAPRNIAMRPDGSVFLIDWELAELSTMPPRDAEVRYAHSHADVGSLMESLVRKSSDYKGGIALLTDDPDPWRSFCALFFNEYVSTRLGFASHKELPDVKDELKELEKSLRANMRQILRSYGRDIDI